MKPLPKPEDRFWSRVQKADGCWLWTGTASLGYGVFSVGYDRYRAHRFSYEIHFGPIPPGMAVCHRCDNPRCCNPAHLFLGTAADNAADKVSKGRQLRGDTAPMAKLSRSDAEAIVARYAAGERQKDLAREYGISKAQASRIVNGVRWNSTIAPLDRTTRAKRHEDWRRERMGTGNGRALLSSEDVAEVRRRVAAGETFAALGREYGVYASTIRDAMEYGRHWKNVA